jgi:hypothetical protein
MKCQRCPRGEDATFRVVTDLIDMRVCTACAEEARRLGIPVHVLNGEAQKKDGDKTNLNVALASFYTVAQ